MNLSNAGGQVKTLTPSPPLLGLSGSPMNTGQTLLSSDEQVCFSTSSGIYCTSDGVISRVWDSTGEDLTVIDGEVCAVVQCNK